MRGQRIHSQQRLGEAGVGEPGKSSSKSHYMPDPVLDAGNTRLCLQEASHLEGKKHVCESVITVVIGLSKQ